MYLSLQKLYVCYHKASCELTCLAGKQGVLGPCFWHGIIVIQRLWTVPEQGPEPGSHLPDKCFLHQVTESCSFTFWFSFWPHESCFCWLQPFSFHRKVPLLAKLSLGVRALSWEVWDIGLAKVQCQSSGKWWGFRFAPLLSVSHWLSQAALS